MAVTASVDRESAEQVGLVYVSDSNTGMRRLRRGAGFCYVTPAGKTLRDRREVQRIKSLAIPPAWTDVWICPRRQGHIQATGRDARGRKQYIYHATWRTLRDQNKYGRLAAFGRSLPKIRRRLRRDLRRRGFPREKIVAAVIYLLQTTLIRVGNEEYAQSNGTFGLTTLRNRHVNVNGSAVRFQFTGKSGIKHEVELHDRRLATIVKQCQELPGQELFCYVDETGVHSLSSGDVNAYLREVSGEDFSAKDFRTWAGTVLAAVALSRLPPASSAAEARRQVNAAIEAVAHQLRNTKTICRHCYVHPAVVAAYSDGSLQRELGGQGVDAKPVRSGGLAPEEAAVLRFLERRARAARHQREPMPCDISVSRRPRLSKC